MTDRTRLYRATSPDETGLRHLSCWTPDRETAEAYTDNPGFGGAHIREIDIETTNVLDLTGQHPLWVGLAEALGYDDSHETARQWLDNGWRYPWEESSEIAQRLGALYEWLRYDDDYPVDGITMLYLGETR